MDNQQWRTWLGESREKQNQLNLGNSPEGNWNLQHPEYKDETLYAPWQNQSNNRQAEPYQAPELGYAPFTGQRYPESNTPMQGNSGAAWGAMPSVVSNPDLYSSGMRQAPGYRPGIGSMTPEAQLVADNEWERQHAYRQQELDKIPAHVAWGDPRIQNVMNAQVPAGTYGGVPGPVQPLQMAPQQTASQLADWERYKQIMSDQRPWQGLR